MSKKFYNQKQKTGNRNYNRKPNRGGSPKSNRRRGQQYIDPAKFVKSATNKEVEAYIPQHEFADFSLNKLIHNNLKARQYITPSPIQDQAIPAALEGRDVIGIASTGTGKTAAFAVPILNRLINEPGSAAAIIIAPTRELAQQIEAECKFIARNSGLFGALLIGGSNMSRQLKDLSRNPRIVIGTPGRIKDHIERKSLKLDLFNMIALDEVDRMLDMGFVNDVTYILDQTHSDRQSLFFSATIDNRVKKLIDNFSNDPFTVSIKPSSTSENVHQDIVRYETIQDKLDKLHNILIKEEVSKVILFDETQRSVERLNKELNSRGFVAEAIHGGRSQGQRQRALGKFKKGEVSILVATDVAARGIDVSDISHVINYSIPNQYDDYIHRIGRAGRAGRAGYALTFVSK